MILIDISNNKKSNELFSLTPYSLLPTPLRMILIDISNNKKSNQLLPPTPYPLLPTLQG